MEMSGQLQAQNA